MHRGQRGVVRDEIGVLLLRRAGYARQKVVGIEPTSPAFETFRVAPQLGKLKHAEASLVTADGSRIRVAVEQDEQGRMTIRLEVPKGKKAQVVFPDGKTRNVGAGTHKLTGK